MKPDEAIKIIQETLGQLDDTIKQLKTIPPIETFGDSIEQHNFTQSIIFLKAARARLEQAISDAGNRKGA
jgi:hypothetical protein